MYISKNIHCKHFYYFPTAGADLGFQKGGANIAFTYMTKKATTIGDTLSMRSMLYLGGSATGKFCKFGQLRLNFVIILSENNITFVYIIIPPQFTKEPVAKFNLNSVNVLVSR